MLSTLSAPSQKQIIAAKGLTLSDYFPQGTAYFYSFPAGEDSQFYNQVPTYEDELVSARPLVCAGDGVKIVTFSAAADEYALQTIGHALPIASTANIISLPADITAEVKGPERNRLVKRALSQELADCKLVMAQPFLDDDLNDLYAIKPEITIGLSDKRNMKLYIPEGYMPRQYARYAHGKDFFDDQSALPLPCVVKVTRSSSGDGVIICSDRADLQRAKANFQRLNMPILIEEHLVSHYNLCVQFGIPFDKSRQPNIIGFNEQVTSANGDFLGGIVNINKSVPHLDEVYKVLLKHILPNLRLLGWYGIGGIDVLINRDGNFHFIDPNLRLTATYAYVYLAETKKIANPMISFSGSYTGSRSDFEAKIVPLTEVGNRLTMISLTHEGNTFRFNAAIEFVSVKDLKRQTRRLLELGVSSVNLDRIVSSNFSYELE